MRSLLTLSMAGVLCVSAKVHALGIDIGPVHLHGTKVKVGNTVELKIIVNKLAYDDEEKDKVRRISGHRVNSDERFDNIRVSWADLDDESKEQMKKIKVDGIYKMKLKRSNDDWEVLKLRRED